MQVKAQKWTRGFANCARLLGRVVANRYVHVPVALMLAVATVLVVPLNSPGCAGPVMTLVRNDLRPTPLVEPVQSNTEVESDDSAIVSAEVLVTEGSKAVAAAEALGASALAARALSDTAEAAAQDANLSPSDDASTAQMDVDNAQATVISAQDNVKFWEDQAAAEQGASGSSSTAEVLTAAKAELATAKTELEKAKGALKTARTHDATAKSAADSARATADSLSKKADAAEQSASTALSTAQEGLTEAESQLAGAQEAKATHTAGHDTDVASAFRAHRSAVRSIEASNAVFADCRSNARPDFAAAGLLVLTAVAVALGPLIGRRRDRTAAARSTGTERAL
jgi:hypothetical protein